MPWCPVPRCLVEFPGLGKSSKPYWFCSTSFSVPPALPRLIIFSWMGLGARLRCPFSVLTPNTALFKIKWSSSIASEYCLLRFFSHSVQSQFDFVKYGALIKMLTSFMAFLQRKLNFLLERRGKFFFHKLQTFNFFWYY